MQCHTQIRVPSFRPNPAIRCVRHNMTCCVYEQDMNICTYQYCICINLCDIVQYVCNNKLCARKLQDLEEVDPPKQFNRSTYFTVSGERRQTEIPMPSSLFGSKPGEVLNRHVSGLYTCFMFMCLHVKE